MKNVISVIDVDSNTCLVVYPVGTSNQRACEIINEALDGSGMTIVLADDGEEFVVLGEEGEEIDIFLTFDETTFYEE